MENWKKIKFEKIAEFKNGLNYTIENSGIGMKVIGVADFKNLFTPNYEELAEINPEGIVNENSILQEGDLVFVRSNGNKNLVGRSLFIENLEETITHSGFCIRARFKEKNLIPKFYGYYFRSSIARRTITMFSGGTGISNLNQEILSNIEVPFPNIESQGKVVQFLTQFDKKIDHNNTQNDTLTALIEAIFRKIYQDTEGVGVFGDLTTQVSTRLGEQAHKEKVAVLSAVKTGHLVRTEDYFSKQVFSDDISNYKRVAPLAFAYNPARANIGSMGMNDLNTEGAVSPVYEVFKAKENYHYWVLMLLKHPNIKRGIEGLCSGTVRQNLKFSDLASLNIKIPDAKAVGLFNVEYEKLKKRYDHNLRQNETLIALRDGLLPKLMTGKITL